MFPNLKLQIFRLRIHQNHLAKVLGLNETTLSKIIHGYREPSESQKRILASHLGADQDWLFEKYENAIRIGTSNTIQSRTPDDDKGDV